MKIWVLNRMLFVTGQTAFFRSENALLGLEPLLWQMPALQPKDLLMLWLQIKVCFEVA